MPQSINLSIANDVNGVPTGAIPFSPETYSFILGAGVEQTMTVPDGVNQVVPNMDPGKGFYMNINSTVAVPTGTTPSKTNAGEFYSAVRRVEPGDVIHMIARESCEGSLSFYKV